MLRWFVCRGFHRGSLTRAKREATRQAKLAKAAREGEIKKGIEIEWEAKLNEHQTHCEVQIGVAENSAIDEYPCAPNSHTHAPIGSRRLSADLQRY
jgi:hypothetical protein